MSAPGPERAMARKGGAGQSGPSLCVCRVTDMRDFVNFICIKLEGLLSLNMAVCITRNSAGTHQSLISDTTSNRASVQSRGEVGLKYLVFRILVRGLPIGTEATCQAGNPIGGLHGLVAVAF